MRSSTLSKSAAAAPVALAPPDCGGAMPDCDFGNAVDFTDLLIGSMAIDLGARLDAPAKLLIHAAGQKPTVNNENLAGHKTCRIGRQKDRGARQFFNIPETLHRRPQPKLVAPFRLIK